MNHRLPLMSAALAAVVGLATIQPVSAQAGNQNRPARTNYAAELKAIVAALADQHQVKITLDPTLFIAAKPQAPKGARIEEALDDLVAKVKGISWRRVYLKQTEANTTPDPARLVEAVRGLDALQHAGLVIENVAGQKASMFVKGFPVPPTFKDELEAQQFSSKAIYVVYGGGGTAGDNAARYMDLQRQSMEMMLQMDPQQLQQAMANGMQMFMNLDPATRSQVMGNMVRSGMQMFMNMSPDQRQGLIQEVMKNMGGMFGQGGPGGGGGPGGPRP